MGYGSRVLGFLWVVALIAVMVGSLGPAPEIINDLGGDKVLHFLAYGTLGFLFTLAYLVHESFYMSSLKNPAFSIIPGVKINRADRAYASLTSPKNLGLTLSLFAFGHSLLGGLIELLQGFTGRQPDIWDGVANSLGSSLGVLAGWIGFYLVSKLGQINQHTN